MTNVVQEFNDRLDSKNKESFSILTNEIIKEGINYNNIIKYVIEFMNEQSVKSQMFVIKKFEDSCNVIKHSDVPKELEQCSSDFTKTPDQEKEEAICPGAP